MSKKSPRKPYSEEAITECTKSINNGKSIYAACKQFGIPISTIRYRRSKQWQNKYQPGPRSILSTEEEKAIASWLSGMQDRGFPVTRDGLAFKVTEFLSANSRPNPFKNNRPGRKWFKAFLRRNAGFSLRTVEEVSSASGRVTEKDIRGWFETVESWLTKNDLREVLEDPTRVFNGDETSFYLHPSTKEVIARKGSRNVYEVQQAAGKKNVTVMFSFGASGAIVTPHVILPGKRIKGKVAQGFPSDWGLGLSANGWMDKPNFRDYIRDIFHPFLVRLGVKFPVIFFVDGHSSHKTLEAADMCLSLGIVLIALYPNTTHIKQPADVAVFKPLKSEWKKAVQEWRMNHLGEILSLVHFGGVLETTVERAIKSTTIESGFRACGLHPFDANAVDYTKCIAKASTNVLPAIAQETQEPPLPEPEHPSFPEPEHPSLSTAKLGQVSIRTEASEAHAPSSEYVSIHMDKVVEAYDLIGGATMEKIEGDVTKLTRDERVIRFFYREFVRPFVEFRDSCNTNGICSPSSSSMQFDVDKVQNDEQLEEPSYLSGIVDINDCQIIHVDDLNDYLDRSNRSVVLELDDELTGEEIRISDVPQVSTRSSTELEEGLSDEQTTDGSIEEAIHGEDVHDSTLSDSVTSQAELPLRENNLEDATNDLVGTGNHPTSPSRATKRRLSEILRLPPTPKRNTKHRNYAMKYIPVLTAGERLEAIRKKEAEKEAIELTKKRKAMERKEAKIKREEAKKARMEERERKKKESQKKKATTQKRKTKSIII